MAEYPSNRKALFQRWFLCDICGVLWPESMLTKQRGLLVCPEDLDEPSAEEIRQRSEQPTEEPRELPWAPDGDVK